MKHLLILLFVIGGCTTGKDFLLLRNDKSDNYFYVTRKGDTVIAPGKYAMCYTDTFRNFAIVSKANSGIIAINRDEKILYQVFLFDNGPDYISDGYFRIIQNEKIGYADKNGNIKISPQFGCAYPFKNGVAKVSTDCKSINDGEHKIWTSPAWFYINKSGKRVEHAGAAD